MIEINSSDRAELSNIPSIDALLAEPVVGALVAQFGRERVTSTLRTLVAEMRAELLGGRQAFSSAKEIKTELIGRLERSYEIQSIAGVLPVINATGVVIHTNLGRAPLSEKSIEAMRNAAGYSTIEYDLGTGKRGVRGEKALDLLKLLTGAEKALIVNNCAAAALLILSVFANGREVIISRGEMVEIGGDFRIPEVLTRSGATLREVGTTNRTHLRDYEDAISQQTAMILKVHPSNYRIKGFTRTPETAEIAKLAQANGILFYEDAGSGALVDLRPLGIIGEPVIRDVLSAGADLVSFSGDKLLGGPQAGIIAGRSHLIEKLASDPFYRALRTDKVTTAALEETLEAYVTGTAYEELPVLKMLATSDEEIARRSSDLVGNLRPGALQAELAHNRSAVGGGASPDAEILTTVIQLSHPHISDAEIEQRLRRDAVIARIEAGKVLIDLRTVSREEEVRLAAVLQTISLG